MWPEVEPAEESPGRLLERDPVAAAVVAFVVRHPERDLHVAHLLARRGPAAGEVSHHLGVAVQPHDVVDVARGEFAQHQSLGFQVRGHQVNLRWVLWFFISLPIGSTW
jgi:hypothetical protein